MNVLVWSSWVAYPVGGQERVSLEIALQLHRRGHRVALVGAYDNVAELRAKIPAEMPFYHFDLHRKRVKPHLAAIRLIGRAAREINAEVISAHGNMFAAHEVARRRDIPFVWTIHGSGNLGTGLIDRVKNAALRRVVNHPRSHLVAVSADSARIIARNYPSLPAERLHVIHNGAVEEPGLLALAPAPIGPPWRLGFIGRLVEGKGPLDLVGLAQRLAGKIDFQIHVFGNGPQEDALRVGMQEANVADRFVLHGYWDKGSPGMVEQFHILIHPSRAEGFASTFLEAQLGARPVIGYNIGGNPESVEDGVTGRLVPLKVLDALAAAVRELTEPRTYRRFADAARPRTMEKFTLARMTDRYLALFEQACASH